MSTRIVRAAALALILDACHAPMSVLVAAGPQSSALATLTWILLAAAAVVFIPVVAFMAMSIVRRRHDSMAVDLQPRGNTIPIVAGAIIPGAILLALFLASVLTEPRFPPDGAQPAAAFEVTGHQWWWAVETAGGPGNPPVAFANELHVPAGQLVELTLLSADVIHSFWIPQLQGKIDLIPGDTNRIRFVAKRAGTYRGQCAEYCGLQHANMAFSVVVDEPADYRRWLASERDDARSPTDSMAVLGARLVTNGTCAACHTIRGTPAHGAVGPDLTHVGSRSTIAAGTLPNNTATLEAWVTDAPSLKPGTGMPALRQYNGIELRAIAAYLRGLQ